MSNILITGIINPIALELIRNFAQHGNNIYTADTSDYTFADKSKYVSRHYKLVLPVKDITIFLSGIVEILKNESIDYIFSISEEGYYISKYSDLIKEQCPNVKILVESIDKIEQLHNKSKFVQLCLDNEIAVPNTIPIQDISDIQEYVKKNNKPVIIKKIY